jgi:hypothetical protein
LPEIHQFAPISRLIDLKTGKSAYKTGMRLETGSRVTATTASESWIWAGFQVSDAKGAQMRDFYLPNYTLESGVDTRFVAKIPSFLQP